MSTARFNTLTDAAGANSMPVADINQGRAKARWNFDGTGTAAFRDSFGIASLTDWGVGIFTMNFSTAQPNANYTGMQISRNASTGTGRGCGAIFTHSVAGFGSETSFISSLAGAATLSDDLWNEGFIIGDPA